MDRGDLKLGIDDDGAKNETRKDSGGTGILFGLHQEGHGPLVAHRSPLPKSTRVIIDKSNATATAIRALSLLLSLNSRLSLPRSIRQFLPFIWNLRNPSRRMK